MNNTFNVLFRLLNFGALFGLIFYAFKKSLLPQLQQFMKKKAADLVALNRNHATLQQQHENIQTTIAQEHSLIEQLKMNLTIWQKVQAAHINADEKKRTELIHAMEKKSAQQAENNAFTHLKDLVIPAAAQQVEQQAYRYYQQDNRQQKYLESIITSLKKGTP